MDSLIGLLQEDDKNMMIVVAQGVVSMLVRLLDSSCLEMKEKTALSSLHPIAGDGSGEAHVICQKCRKQMVATGVCVYLQKT
ncbi:hypothetical protein V6N11_036911 [Hibiscus sabdariffa]|uniref:Uncharacterized protein n=1 Tax=Hibiscus sabdariffa TaxID=183260 RepID=A0ABR2RC91_9ROSI